MKLLFLYCQSFTSSSLLFYSLTRLNWVPLIPERMSGLSHRISTVTFKTFLWTAKGKPGAWRCKHPPTETTRVMDSAIDWQTGHPQGKEEEGGELICASLGRQSHRSVLTLSPAPVQTTKHPLSSLGAYIASLKLTQMPPPIINNLFHK